MDEKLTFASVAKLMYENARHLYVHSLENQFIFM